MTKRKCGQSTLEYIIIFTAVVGAIWFATSTIVKPRTVNIIDKAMKSAENSVDRAFPIEQPN